MSEGGLLTSYSATIVFDRYDDIKAALFDANLSRTFDKRSYEDGNIRSGIVSIAHGAMHRARRRIENTQFRADVLRLYERELFPRVMNALLDNLIDRDRVDLFPIGELLSVVLAARRAGIEYDPSSLEDLRTLVRHVDVFSQGSAILDAKDPDAVRKLVRATYAEFERDFVRPAWSKRAALIERVRGGELAADELPHDILTVLLLHREDLALELADDGPVVREVATYLQGGTHTSAQTLVNALDLIFATGPNHAAIVDRVAADTLFAQRVVQETLRLRPTTPKMKRRAEARTEIAGRSIPKDSLVVLDVVRANRDPRLFGADPEGFDPDRTVDPNVPRWGLSFGAGPHQCPGRSVGGGFPIPASFEVADDHVFGLVALELQAVARRGVRPDGDRQPERDLRTDRFTRWLHYPVRFERLVRGGPLQEDLRRPLRELPEVPVRGALDDP
ncbi:MAG TPA: cytochrome P450 [Candidatus Limnocylindria bacterium]|jgi:cytochrome P450|nr:cytochrome P450 [Candidatus Limnocylindria bacterium]